MKTKDVCESEQDITATHEVRGEETGKGCDRRGKGGTRESLYCLIGRASSSERNYRAHEARE